MQSSYLKAGFLIIFCLGAMFATASENACRSGFATGIPSVDELHIVTDRSESSATAVIDVFSDPVKTAKHFVITHYDFGHIYAHGSPAEILGSTCLIAASHSKDYQKLLIFPFYGFW